MATVKFAGSQKYRLAGSREHIRKDGSKTTLDIWEAECARCGASFTFTSPSEAKTFSPNRRCQEHKRPGKRVA